MGKHTPGLWRVVFTKTIYGTEAYLLRDAQDDVVHYREANARLIAAAPDLLAVAQGLAAWDGTDDHLARLAEQARVAIAKAEGQEGLTC